MMRSLLTAAAIALLASVGATGCDSHAAPGPMTQDMTLGGMVIPASMLEDGRLAYHRYCRQCHGDHGDGKGPAALGLVPAPRDFTKGAFKFLSVENGQLPTDEDLKRIIRGGLKGTAMLPWDISEPELDAVVQYIKTFKPECPPDKPKDKCLSRWEKAKKPTTSLPLPANPNTDPAKIAELTARGKLLYHMKGCNSCHPSYVTREEYYKMTKAWTANPVNPEMRLDPYVPELKEAIPFGKIMPPDFSFRVLRSGERVEDIFRTITAGVGPMPTWKNEPEADRWALAYYVHSLLELRDTPAGWELRRTLDEQPKWTPPAEPTSAPATPAPANP